jgi:hypothetical protein
MTRSQAEMSSEKSRPAFVARSLPFVVGDPMRVRLFLTILIVPAMAAASCAGKDSSSSTNPSAPSVQWQVVVQCPEFGESSHCTAIAMSDHSGGDVTGLAQWSTGDPTIATVSSTGLVTATATGEVSIRASYQGATGFTLVWASPGQGLSGIYRTLQGMVLSLNGALPGVLMEILNGPNAGRSMTTTQFGTFYMDGLQDGQFTIRLSKSGYVTAEYVWSIPGGKERLPALSVSK